MAHVKSTYTLGNLDSSVQPNPKKAIQHTEHQVWKHKYSSSSIGPTSLGGTWTPRNLRTRITKLCPIKICLNILMLKISTLLGYYAVYSGNSLPMLRDNPCRWDQQAVHNLSTGKCIQCLCLWTLMTLALTEPCLPYKRRHYYTNLKGNVIYSSTCFLDWSQLIWPMAIVFSTLISSSCAGFIKIL
jgi:hypothetical protein